MSEFRLIQISDTHLARRYQPLTDNFHRVSEYIDSRRPDLVVNSGDVGWDGPTHRDDLEFARELHAGLPVACRYLPGNHDVGDNPTAVGPPPPQPVTEPNQQAFIDIFGEDRWRFEAAGWCFVGLNSLVMNTGLASEAEQFDWLASQLASAALSQRTRRPRTRKHLDPLRSDAGPQTSDRDAARRRSAAGRFRPRPSAA